MRARRAAASVLAAAALLLGTCAAESNDDLTALNAGGCRPDNPCFVGHWELISGRHDGRYRGRSARSFRKGDSFTIAFDGDRLLVFGLTGPTGGLAFLLMTKFPQTTIDFYSPTIKKHVLVYSSRVLPKGPHFALFVVAGRHSAFSRGNYVNIDRVQPLARS